MVDKLPVNFCLILPSEGKTEMSDFLGQLIFACDFDERHENKLPVKINRFKVYISIDRIN